MTFKILKEFTGFSLYNNKDICIYIQNSEIDLNDENLRSSFWRNRISDNDIEEVKIIAPKVKKQDNI